MADHDKCEHTIECEKRIKSLLKEIAMRLSERSEAARDVGNMEWIAETRAQAVVMMAIANRCMENIRPDDQANIDNLVNQVSALIDRTEAQVESKLQKGSESAN